MTSRFACVFILGAACVLTASRCVRAEEPPLAVDPRMNTILDEIRRESGVPGVVAAVVVGDRVVAAGASGVRKVGSPEPITVNDQIHIGSCTKSFTCTLIGLLIDEGKLDWSTTLSRVFPELEAGMDPAFRGVTLEQLMTHRAGLPHDGAYKKVEGDTSRAGRRALVEATVKRPPDAPPGSRFEYSNLGYLLAAAMAERVTDRDWEDLIRARLFVPLGMTSSGFGPPGTPGQVDQPWGHISLVAVLLPRQGDNIPLLGPAGRVRTTLADWARYVAFHYDGRAPSGLRLDPKTLARLHAPVGKEAYGCGWARRKASWTDAPVIWHNGSNTMWYAEMWVVPSKRRAVLVATNEARPSAMKACQTAARRFGESQREALEADAPR